LRQFTICGQACYSYAPFRFSHPDAAVAHQSHGQHGEGLQDVVVAAGAADLFQEDGVGPAQDLHLLLGHAAGAADGEARAREGVAAHEHLGQAELAAERPHLVLEQLAQRLHQLHAGRPPTLWWLAIVTKGRR
jgi:hypothetical protein